MREIEIKISIEDESWYFCSKECYDKFFGTKKAIKKC